MADLSLDAQVAKARELYMMFVRPSVIRRDTGISHALLKEMMVKWRAERDDVAFGDDYANDIDRCRYVSHQAVVLAVDEIYEIIKHKKNLKNKRGEKVFMDMYETDAMLNIMLKLDRIMPILKPLMNPEPANMKDVGPDAALVTSKYEVITSHKVLKALKKDKAMLNMLLKEAHNGNEQDNGRPDGRETRESDSSRGSSPSGEQRERESRAEVRQVSQDAQGERPGDSVRVLVAESLPETQEPRDGRDAELGVSISVTALSEREANRLLGEPIARVAEDRGAVVGSDKSSPERDADNTAERAAKDVSRETLGAKADPYSESDDDDAIRASRESRAGEPDFAREPETGLDDVFEDEFT